MSTLRTREEFSQGKAEVLIKIAEWMGESVDWLYHVEHRDFKCGCRPYDEDHYYCDEWTASLEVGQARKRLEKAQAILNKTRKSNE